MRSTGRVAQKWLLMLLLFSSLGEAATGPETAQLLNARYQSRATECVGGKPAYFCSGVLLRGSTGTRMFWEHSEQAEQLGAQSFNYLRADLDTRALEQPNGMIFSDGFTAIGQGKSFEVLCAYPFAFALQSTRPDSGCGWVAAARSVQDLGSCRALGVTDTPSWLAHFAQEGQQAAGQCSLSSQDPAQFMASLTAHQALDAQWAAQPTLLQIRNWPEQTPDTLPILGLFYDVNRPQSLLGAQKDQRDYFNATGDWLPVLRMDLTQAPQSVFGFHQDDQLYIGYQVAARLNKRSIEKITECRGGTAAFNCTGVLIRSADVSPAFHSWSPSQSSVNGDGVSFSFITDGALIKKTFKSQGFVMRESLAPASQPLTVRCMYPFDADTSGSDDICRSKGRARCEELGIDTREKWIAAYGDKPKQTCAFSTEPGPFQLATTVRPDAADPFGWNELIMAAWSDAQPEKLPFEAITIITPSHRPPEHEGGAEGGAQFIQRDYFEVTGRFIPVLRATFTQAPGEIFSYDPQDQALADVTMTQLSNAIPFVPSSMRDD